MSPSPPTEVPLEPSLPQDDLNPIKQHHLIKTSIRRGRPTFNQVQAKQTLLSEFLHTVLINKHKINSKMVNTTTKNVINEEDVVVLADKVPRRLLLLIDEMKSHKINYTQYFDKDFLQQLKNLIKNLNGLPWICPTYDQYLAFSNDKSIGCDQCNSWFHLLFVV